tara:strand:+ start:165 stop:929 length:765 start_codon:yes stop_codon:yes gene_type:complete
MMSEIVVSGKDSRSLVRALDSIHPFPKSARYNTRTTSDMTEHGHDREAFCVGILHSFRQGPRVGVKTKWPHLQDAQSACISMAKKYVPDFEYTSIQINKNFAGALHVDRGNVGPSTMLTVGTDMNGGNLYIHGVGTVKTKNKFIFFNGNVPHMTLPYSGKRYSIVYFTHTSAKSVLYKNPKDVNHIKKMGYNVPSKKRFKSMYKDYRNDFSTTSASRLDVARQNMPKNIKLVDRKRKPCGGNKSCQEFFKSLKK